MTAIFATLNRHAKSLAIFGLDLFGTSIAFPLIASLFGTESLPNWFGLLDVGVALILILLMMGLSSLMQKFVDDRVKLLCYRFYGWLASLPIILLGLFFILPNAIDWNILLPGLAWRVWLLAYSLPALVAALLNKK